jgi:UDPglucose--hexose-1-phosphate uridylyltransferase
MVKKSKKKFPSELRLDVVSGDWVVIATGRAKRPETFKKERRKIEEVPKEKCPFCQIETQEKPILVFANGKKIFGKKIPKDWTTIVIPNKYPAFVKDKNLNAKMEGPYQIMNAVGLHELVVTRDHQKSMGQFDTHQIKEVIDTYQSRYLNLMKTPEVHYVSIFHNHGVGAGASQVHPHSQIAAVPLIDADLRKALSNSQKYFENYGKCVYCQMNDWEMKRKERIVFENRDFLVICPFASKSAFEIIISPKKHLAYFEKITEREKLYLSEAFKVALAKLYKGLNDPAYNFYLHTSPCDGKNYDFYHWHWTILPKTATWAGFELGARMEISTIEPEKAAEYLRRQRQ